MIMRIARQHFEYAVVEMDLPEYLGVIFVLLPHFVQELNVANAKKFK